MDFLKWLVTSAAVAISGIFGIHKEAPAPLPDTRISVIEQRTIPQNQYGNSNTAEYAVLTPRKEIANSSTSNTPTSGGVEVKKTEPVVTPKTIVAPKAPATSPSIAITPTPTSQTPNSSGTKLVDQVEVIEGTRTYIVPKSSIPAEKYNDDEIIQSVFNIKKAFDAFDAAYFNTNNKVAIYQLRLKLGGIWGKTMPSDNALGDPTIRHLIEEHILKFPQVILEITHAMSSVSVQSGLSSGLQFCVDESTSGKGAFDNFDGWCRQ